MPVVVSYQIGWDFANTVGTLALDADDGSGTGAVVNIDTLVINELADLIYLDTLLRNNNEIEYDPPTKTLAHRRPTGYGTRVRFSGSISGS